ncbi:MAG: beta-galactosidase [Lentisphaeria bacterium]|nr:beta-galactosidase [Lentisphaeria bacterium]
MKSVFFGTLLLLTAYSASAIPVDLLHCEFSRCPGSSYPTEGNPLSVQRRPGGWQVNIAKNGRTTHWLLPYHAWKIAKPDAVVLRGRATKGKACVRFGIYDAANRFFYTPWQWVDKDSDRIVFPLDTAGGKAPYRIWRMQIDTPAPDTELFLRRIDTVFNRHEKDALQLVPDTGERYLAAYDRTPRFFIRNGSGKHFTGRAAFILSGLNGKKWDISRNVDLPPYGECAFTPQNPPPAYGSYYGREDRATQRLMISYVPYNGLKLPPNKEFEFAVDNHWVNAGVIEGLDYLGIRAIRTIVGWEKMQPVSGNEWNFKVFDSRLERLEKAGVKMRETLVFTPRWAVIDNPQNLSHPRNRMPKMEAWRNYVRTIAQRYGKRVQLVELWNEPDLPGFFNGSVEEYINYCREARKIIREVCPELKMSSGGFATFRQDLPFARNAGKFHEAVLKNAADTFDYHSYHEHGFFPHYQRMIDEYFLPLRKKYNITQPWFASETAYHSAKGTDDLQADCLFKKVLFAWARGAVSYTWYGLFNNNFDLDYSEHNYGMIDYFMNVKYAFGIYAALIANYREASFVKQIPFDGKAWIFVFKKPSGFLIPNWKNSALGSRICYAAVSDARTAAVIDHEGNRETVPVCDGVTFFFTGSNGQSLELAGAGKLHDIRLAAELNCPNAVISGNRTKSSVTVVNPWKKAVRCRITPVEKAGMKYHRIPAERVLPPGSGTQFDFEFSAQENGGEVAVAIRFDDQEKLILSTPVKAALLSKNADFNNRKPDFVMQDYSKIENTFEFDPESAKKAWKNSGDLSAEVWIGTSGKNLELQVAVRDDIHKASPHANRMWLGDSVQFALEFPRQSGNFELGGALNADGKPYVDGWKVPAKVKLQDVLPKIKLDISGNGDKLIYRFSIPQEALKINQKQLTDGFRFNILVNDNDNGRDRKCYMRLAPGIGRDHTMQYSPLVICR